MIECTDKFLLKKKRHKKLWRFIAFFIVIIIGFVIYNSVVVANNLNNICGEYMLSKGSESITNAVEMTMHIEGDYNDIITIEKNSTGDITLITSSPLKINKITREIISKTNVFMSDIIDDGVPIPALAFSGISLISGYGKKVLFKTITIATVNCDIRNEFESSGVNQTLHSIFVDVEIVYNTDFQFRSKKNYIKSSVLLCSSVVVGKVPDVYLNGKILSQNT